jgi:hypothetical protein
MRNNRADRKRHFLGEIMAETKKVKIELFGGFEWICIALFILLLYYGCDEDGLHELIRTIKGTSDVKQSIK